jgi:hypothetical protein
MKKRQRPRAPRIPCRRSPRGGGGAFLHPTHEEDVSLLAEEAITEASQPRVFALKTAYPDMKRSAPLTWQNLKFLARNPRFGIVPAIIYLLTCWLVGASVGDAVPRTPWQALRITLDVFGANPGLALWIFAIVGCILAFTDTHSRAYRVIGGLAHCGAHLTAMFYVGWGARLLADQFLPTDNILRSLTTGTAIFLGGWAAGSIVMGVYLLISRDATQPPTLYVSILRHWHPDFGTVGEVDATRKNADDRVGLRIDSDGLPDDAGAPAKSRPPELITKDGDTRAIRCVLFRKKPSAELRTDSQDLQQIVSR